MTKWREVELSEIVERVTTKNDGGEIDNVLTVSAQHGLVPQETYFTKKVASTDTTGYGVVAPGQFVYNKSSTKSSPFGTVARNDGVIPGIVSPLYFVFEAKPNGALPEFLELVLNSEQFFSSLQGMLREGARAHGALNVRVAEFYSARIALPSVYEQERIVELIGAIDDQLAALTAESNALSRTFARLRADLLRAGPGWEEIAIGDVADAVTGRAFPHRLQGHSTGKIPYFKVSDMSVSGNETLLSEARNWLDEQGIAAIRPRVCPAGTIVFPILGAALGTEKRRTLARSSGFDQNLMGLVLSERVTSAFMLAVMSEIKLAQYAQRGAVPSVNKAIVSSIRFSLAPIDVQEKIGSVLDEVRRHVESLVSETEALRAVRATVLSDLLNQDLEIGMAEEIVA